MNRILFISSLFLSFFIVVSCYKDQGNYDYVEINELKVEGLLNHYERDQDDSLSIVIDLKGTQYSDTNRFTYEWEIARKIISENKDLHTKVDMKVGDHLGRFIVTDKNNGSKEHFRFNLRVSTSTAGDMLVVLSNYNGEAELSYKRLDQEGEFVVNYYKNRFEESLGKGPKGIVVNYNYFKDKEPFSDVATLGGMHILSEDGLKVIDKNTLGPKEGLDVITGASFASILPPYPVPDVSNFKPEFVRYQPDLWIYTPHGGINQVGSMFLISAGNLYYNNTTSYRNTVYVNQKVSDGYLSPAMCYAYVKNSVSDVNRPSNTKGFDLSSYILFFDSKNGKFLYSNAGRTPVPILNTSREEYLDKFPGYSMIYATHTSTPNKCVAVLHNGSQAKLVYLTVPGDATQANTTPFSIDGVVDVSNDIVNKDSKFHSMRYSPYIIFSSGSKLYRYNVLSILSKAIPTEIIANLSTMGYDADATIPTFTVSRTERYLIMGVSRYKNDQSGTGEPKGDVIQMKLNSSIIGLTFDKKFESVSGNPVDIQIKYQTFNRDGLDANGDLVDKI
ncbi:MULTISPECIES: PKD-like family lipoprotein [Sphingobacterium]|uniref:PKD-like family lipoprotein n=1 Tax=Sphingobacterium TaxID=28453 RepID=UPI0013DBBA9A|nr:MULTISPECIES: PKD-like family lipoprotein [unclassified Sphingobacterium]